MPLSGSPGRPRKIEKRPYGYIYAGSTCIFKLGKTLRTVAVLSEPSPIGKKGMKRCRVMDLDTRKVHHITPKTLHRGSMLWNIDSEKVTQPVFTGDECSICQEEYHATEVFPCKHAVCSACWKQWSNRFPKGEAKCPECREKVQWLEDISL